ncbi:MAG TPA: polysaccharide deacetylase family protein [Bacteroidia bacterium]|nr:polysaccharide deacetylase family protein [Bacteroidia bacterium]
MLNFRNSNILLLIAVISMIAVRSVYPFSLIFFILPFLIWSGLVFYGCYRIDSEFFIPVKCKGEEDEKLMALTFDDGPSAKFTPAILDILKAMNVKATFFCIGRNIEGNENILKRMHAEGHTIGNHSYSHHFWFDLFSVKKMTEDLRFLDTKVFATLSVTPRMFRPPYGVTNPNVRDTIIRSNYFPVGWSIRSMDTVAKDCNLLQKKVRSRFHPGAVILFHDTGKCTPAVLQNLITDAQNQGYQWVRVDQLFQINPYV